MGMWRCLVFEFVAMDVAWNRRLRGRLRAFCVSVVRWVMNEFFDEYDCTFSTALLIYSVRFD